MRTPLSIVIAATVVALAVLLASPFDGITAPNLAIGALCAVAFAAGAWFAPASFGRDAVLFGAPRTPQASMTKMVQFVGGALAMVVAHTLLHAHPGVAVIVGIAVAIGIGAVGTAATASSASRQEDDARP